MGHGEIEQAADSRQLAEKNILHGELLLHAASCQLCAGFWLWIPGSFSPYDFNDFNYLNGLNDLTTNYSGASAKKCEMGNEK